MLHSIEADEAFLVALEKAKISHRIKLGQRIRFVKDMMMEPYSGLFKFSDLPRRMGAFSYSNSPLSHKFSIGRYCSFASGIETMGNNHPVDRFSTSPLSYGSWRRHPNIAEAIADAGLTEEWKDLPYRTGGAGVTIGHDVWIGQGVLLGNGIEIGTGSIIGARSIVTKDIPPYSIAVGTPAKVKRRRFSDALVERLLQSEWWNYHLKDMNGLSFDDVGNFLSEFEDRKNTLERYAPRSMTARELLGHVARHM